MIDYSKTNIYKLCCKDTSITDIYIGSTVNWRVRKYYHKFASMNTNARFYNFKVYKFIREHGGWDNWDMIIVEEYPCENKRQKEQRERYWFELLGGSLNSQAIAVTNKEKRERRQYLDRTKYKERRQQYRENNREEINKKIREINSERYTCVCGSIIRKDSKSKHEKTNKHKKFTNQ